MYIAVYIGKIIAIFCHKFFKNNKKIKWKDQTDFMKMNTQPKKWRTLKANLKFKYSIDNLEKKIIGDKNCNNCDNLRPRVRFLLKNCIKKSKFFL